MTFNVTFRAAEAHLAAKRWQAAEALYRQLLAAKPQHSGSLYGLGVICLYRRDPAAALNFFKGALASPFSGDLAAIHAGLAAAHRRLGNGALALEHYKAVAVLRPDDPNAHHNLGIALTDQAQLSQAVESLQRALLIEPRFGGAKQVLVVLLNRLCRFAEAELLCTSPPDQVDWGLQGALAVALKGQGRLREAAAILSELFGRDPGDLDVLFNLGLVFKDQGRTDDAIESFRTLIKLKPDHAAARVALCMAHLPPLYEDENEIGRRRSDYTLELVSLEAWASGRPIDALTDGIGVCQPFYLAYQGRDGVKLQALYGRLACRASAGRHVSAALAARPQEDEPIRVGFVSGYFRRHANWWIPTQGWMRSLTGPQFRLFGYHTGAVQDDQTARAAELCERFDQGPLSVEEWRNRVSADSLHLLIYPEVGMDPTAAQLAAQRLAPVQCNGWGHPFTSGFPTLDYFISSQLMEPEAGDEAYTERLVRLPNLSTAFGYRSKPQTSMTRKSLGLHRDGCIFWCGQSPSKYLPQYDDVWVRIAETVRSCQFVFVAFPGSDELTAQFQARLVRAFARRGLDALHYCRILPRMTPDVFFSAMGCADVVLDSIGWSGCNSLVDSLEHGLPVVTVPGETMRSRHGAAILTRLGWLDGICANLDDYVERAVFFALNPEACRTASMQLRQNRNRLYSDAAASRAFEAFVVGAARRI